MASSYPTPSGENRHCGYLLKLGELNKSWKRRWCALDTKNHYLYWYTKPSGKVKGGLPLTSNCNVTELGAPDYAFRVSWDGKFRDFRAESAATFPTWMKHINDQIGIYQQKGKSLGDSDSVNFKLEAGGPSDRTVELERQVEALEDQLAELEEENSRLRNAGSQSEITSHAESRIQELLAENAAMRQELEELETLGAGEAPSEAALLDELEDIKYHLGAAKRRIKQLEAKGKEQAALIRELQEDDGDRSVEVPGL